MRGLAALALLAGCYRPSAEPACSIACTDETGCPDGLRCTAGRCGDTCGSPPIDASVDTPDGSGPRMVTDAPAGCYGEADFIVCNVSMTAGPVQLSSVNTNPGFDTHCQDAMVGVTPACAIAYETIEIDDTMVIGPRMLVLIASTITFASGATLNVSGSGLSDGPGARACMGGTGQAAGTNGAGGSGGSYVTAGGAGGAGGTATTTAANPIAPGAFGGCHGGGGGGTSPGPGGAGGGAVLLIATQAIALDGAIHACGAGGYPGFLGGGGGGGSGGTIILMAPAISTSGGSLIAVGGGGGAGGDGSSMMGAGDTCDAAGVARGMTSSRNAGDGAGGDGHDGHLTYGGPGGAGTASTGGGGGGGGKGRIEVRTQSPIDAVIVPPL